jgi:cytochrome c5
MGNFIGVLIGLVVIAFVAYFVANFVTSDTDETGPNARMQAKIEENIRPVGQVNTGAVSTAPAAAAEARSGDQVYTSSCLACHSTGVAGAPKTGDKDAWTARAGKGVDGLLATAISGINAMPPKGTCMDCSDDELKAAIEYILKESGL